MSTRCRGLPHWLAIFGLLALPVRAAELVVLTAGAFKPVAAALIPGFEASSGNRVTLRNDTVGGLLRRIEANEPFDVVLMSPSGLETLGKGGRIAPGSVTSLARVGIGVAVRRGAAMPDIASVAGFKATMLHAHTVAIIDPVAGGSSGIAVARLFQTLGIAEAMVSKLVLVKGGLAADAVVDGRADVAVQQISELIAVPGAALVGPLPPEIQHETVYAGAVAADAKAPDAAKALLAVLSGPAARPVLQEKGMIPP